MNMLPTFILLCLAMAQTCGMPLGPEHSDTINMVRGEIERIVSKPTMPRDVSGHMLNSADLLGLDWCPLAACDFSLIGCYMTKVSLLDKDLEGPLNKTAQWLQDMAHDQKEPNQNCSLSTYEDKLDKPVLFKSVLLFVDDCLHNMTRTCR